MPTIQRDKVVIGAITFNETVTKPAEAVSWGLDTLDGWDDTVELDDVTTPLGGGSDGIAMADYFPALGRELLLSGWAWCASRLEADTLIDVLVRDALPANVLVTLTRYEPIPKWVKLRLVGQVSVKKTKDGCGFRWVAQALTPSPFKYDVQFVSDSAGVAGISSGGRTYPRRYPLTYTTITGGADDSATVFNRGSVYTWPVITLTGPLNSGSWHISNETTGDDIRFETAVAAGHTLVIDFASQTALLDGLYPVTTTITGDFFRIVPGANTIKIYADFDAAAGMTVSINSAWR